MAARALHRKLSEFKTQPGEVISESLVVTLLAPLLSACAPIPQEPSRQFLCRDGYFAIPVGESAADPHAIDLPGHVDIMMVETRLDGETLTATFHFKDIPETMGLNREGMPFSTFEYFHTVNTNTIPMLRFTLHRNP